MFARPHPLCLPRASPNTCLLLRDYLVLPRKQQSLKPVLPVCAQGATPAFIGVQKNPGSWQGELFSMLCAFWSFAAPTKPHDEPMATWAALQLAGSCPRGALARTGSALGRAAPTLFTPACLYRQTTCLRAEQAEAHARAGTRIAGDRACGG